MTTARNPGAARKRHVVVVGHMVDDRFFGAERSLLEILAAVDRDPGPRGGDTRRALGRV